MMEATQRETIRGLSAGEMMAVWERGSARSSVDRGVLLLAWSLGVSEQEAARIDIAHRDQHLLRLRTATLGTQLQTLLACVECGENLELTLDAQQFLSAANPPDAAGEREGDSMKMRLPDSNDLRAAAASISAEEASHVFFLRCVRNSDNQPITTEPTETLLAQYSEWLAHMAPGIEINLEVNCPACGEVRTVAFDIVSFFWREIEATCSRLVREVDALARTYGWSERHILGMSALRRNLYLETANA